MGDPPATRERRPPEGPAAGRLPADLRERTRAGAPRRRRRCATGWRSPPPTCGAWRRPQRARVRCNVALDVETDGPVSVVLGGCNRGPCGGGAPRAARPTGSSARRARRSAGGGCASRPRCSRAGGYSVDIFQQSRRPHVLGNRRVARFRSGAARSPGGRAVAGQATACTSSASADAACAAGAWTPGGSSMVRRDGPLVRGRRGYYRRKSCGDLTSSSSSAPSSAAGATGR